MRKRILFVSGSTVLVNAFVVTAFPFSNTLYADTCVLTAPFFSGSRINCNIFSYDYSGYGASAGKPSEKNLYADIDAAWNHLRTKYGISPGEESLICEQGYTCK